MAGVLAKVSGTTTESTDLISFRGLVLAVFFFSRADLSLPQVFPELKVQLWQHALVPALWFFPRRISF